MSGETSATNRATVLLWCGVLHAFTHSFHVILMPLYLPLQRDLGLANVGQATFLMTLLMVSYFLPSYGLGVMADRYDRRLLLGIGLCCNGLGFLVLGTASGFGGALVGVVVAGIGGSFYHPAATSLIAQLYSSAQGKAFGLVGIGANVGFLCVPVYAGWRLDRLSSQMGDAAWRRPVIELGGLAVVCGLLFLWQSRRWEKLTVRASVSDVARPLFHSRFAVGLFIAAALAFSLRDFAGMSMGSLGALFLQQAHGFNATTTGVALSAIFLAAIVSNPLFGGLSDRHRYRWIALVMTVAGVCVMVFPRLPAGGLIPGLVVYGFFFMACYPMVEAALVESVPSESRGRVFGLFFLISGMIGNLSHWLIGVWVGKLEGAASDVGAYETIYIGLGFLIWVSMVGLICLRMLGSSRPMGQAEGAEAPSMAKL